MNQKLKFTNKPISLITFFVGIAIITISEIKYVNPELQIKLFWFAVLIIIFAFIAFIAFIISMFKPIIWYSPRDFRDDKNFLSLINSPKNNIAKKRNNFDKDKATSKLRRR